jgi:hypothetical protein
MWFKERQVRAILEEVSYGQLLDKSTLNSLVKFLDRRRETSLKNLTRWAKDSKVFSRLLTLSMEFLEEVEMTDSLVYQRLSLILNKMHT